MCGIAGFVGLGDRNILKAMCSSLAHRGPDGEGQYVDEASRVYLGHRRLSVIDVASGRQPMWNEAGSVGVVFNGEIYNHREMRRELEGKGHRFATDHSDTEVLVHGYEEWGTALPERLHGMFAFAIYDRRHGQLFLARDRFGEKPLFFSLANDGLIFASELRALAYHPAVDTSLNTQAIKKLFGYGFIPAPQTMFRGARKLPAGSTLLFSIRAEATAISRPWRFRIEPQEPKSSDGALVEEFEHLFDRAVHRRLESDVPLGIFLSGGVDSSSVLAMAARHIPGESLSTFSIGFDDSSYDESAYARLVASHFGTRHTEKLLDLKTAEREALEVASRVDEPNGDSSLVATYLLSRTTREHVTVALGGDGGDELLAGYDPFKALAVARLYRAVVPRPVHDAVVSLAARALPVSSRNMGFDFLIRRALGGLRYPPSHWNPAWLGPFSATEMSEILHEPVSPEDLYEEAIAIWEESTAPTLVDKSMEFYTNLYLSEGILAKTDRASMLTSLEVRAPFLDIDLVEFLRRLPVRYKFSHGRTKVLLRRALDRHLPRAILRRPKKGFGIPISSWLRRWQPPIPHGEESAIDVDWLTQKWRDHASSRADYRQGLWCWIALNRWLASLPDAATARLPASMGCV